MLPVANRLKKRINFARIELEGKIIQSKNFGIGYYDRQDSLDTKFGIVISTKVSKKAVVRNRIKRIITDLLRKSIANYKKGFDVTFLLKSSATRVNRLDLEKEINETITKVL